MIDFLFHNPDAVSQIEMGSIGWEDEDEYYFLGTDENDGHTLVRVQLFRGRDVTKPINPERAQGHKIVCHLSGGLFRIPKKGTRCYIAIPKGMESMPGAGVIFATVEKSPSTQFDADRAVMDFGDDVHVVFKGKSISLQDPDNRFLTVGTPRSGGAAGITLQAKDGSGGVIQEGVVSWFVAQNGEAKSVIQMTPTKWEVFVADIGFVKLDGGEFWSFAPVNKMMGGGCYIGKAPTPANPALWGITGVAGAASTSVFLSV